MSIQLFGKNHKVKKKSGKFILNLSKKNISDLDEVIGLDKIINLNKLILKKNKIKEIKNLDNLMDLEILDLSENLIVRIENIENLKNLTELYLSKNKIKEAINLNNNPNLQIINLRNNEITDLEILNDLPKLESFMMDENPIYKKSYNKFKFSKKFKDKWFIEYGRLSEEERTETENELKLKVKLRTYRGIEISEIFDRIDKYIEKNLLVDNNIHFPIENSKLFHFIKPYVKKEEILYSTLCRGYYHQSGPPLRETLKWESHIFITKDAIMYTVPKTRFFRPTPKLPVVYHRWKYYGLITNDLSNPYETYHWALYKSEPKFKTDSIKADFSLTVIYHKDYETELSFSKRKFNFGSFCRFFWVRALFSSIPIDFDGYYENLKIFERRAFKKAITTVFSQVFKS